MESRRINVRYRGWSLESERSKSRLPFAWWTGRLNACIDRLLNDLSGRLPSSSGEKDSCPPRGSKIIKIRPWAGAFGHAQVMVPSEVADDLRNVAQTGLASPSERSGLATNAQIICK